MEWKDICDVLTYIHIPSIRKMGMKNNELSLVRTKREFIFSIRKIRNIA